MEKLLSPKKLGKLLGVATATLANNRSTGIGIQIPYIKISSGAVRYKESDVEDYIEANTYSHSGKIKIKGDKL